MFNNHLSRVAITALLFAATITGCKPKPKIDLQVAKPVALYSTITLYSKILKEDRKISIYVPADSAYKRFGVMYLLDGEVQMDMVAGQMKYMDASGPNQMVLPTIVVGIENTDRTRDLTPTHVDESVSHIPGNTGGGDKFLAFINEELKPYIEQHYPTAPYSTFSGHSLGGLTVLNCLFKHPEMFSNYIAISPSLFWDDKLMIKQAETALKGGKNLSGKKLFFSDGNEGKDWDFHPNLLAMKATLDKYHPAGLTYRYKPYPGESHQSEPLIASYDAAKLIYEPIAPRELSGVLTNVTIEQIKAHYDKVSSWYGFRINPSLDTNNILLSYVFSDPGTEKLAVSMAEWNVQLYPKAASAWASLGDIYKQLHEEQKAAEGYKKALDLKPGDTEVTKKLAALSKS